MLQVVGEKAAGFSLKTRRKHSGRRRPETKIRLQSKRRFLLKMEKNNIAQGTLKAGNPVFSFFMS